MKQSLLFILSIFFISLSVFSAEKAHVGYVYPAGGKQGSRFEVIVGGQNLGGIKGIYVSGKGVHGEVVGIIPKKKQSRKNVIKEQENEQIAEKVRIAITIDKDATLGIRDFRLETKTGFSNRIFFEVNELNEIKEKEPNNSGAKATMVKRSPVLINGQIMPGDRDCFRITAQKGQTIVCETKARTLVPYLADAVPGWFQATLRLSDSKGKEVAYNDDFMLRPDPVIIFDVDKTGEYILEIKDAIYRGREDFVYRISVGEIPFIQSIYPLGGRKGQKTQVTLEGVNLSKTKLTIPIKKNATDKHLVSVRGKNGLTSNAVQFSAGTYPEQKEGKENNRMGMAEKLSRGTVINGKIDEAWDEDWFEISGKKNDKIVVDVTARRLGSPMDAGIDIYDGNKRRLMQNDDFVDRSEGMATHHADARLIFKVPKDGSYFIRVRDIQGHGGKEYAYRLFVGIPRPDFDLRIEPSNITITRGGTVAFTIHALRKYKFNGEIKLDLKDLPDGYVHSDHVIKKGQDQVRMTLTAPDDAPLGTLGLNLVGVAQSGGRKVVRKAEPAEELMQAFIYLHLLPAKDFLATVAEPLPFRLTAEIENDRPLKLNAEEGATLKIKIHRSPDFKFPVRLLLDKQPRGIMMKPVVLTSDQDEAIVTIVAPRVRPNQEYNLVIKGVARIGKKKKSKVITAITPAFAVETPSEGIVKR